MKKTWNSPEVQELTIQATASGGNGGRGGNGGPGGNGVPGGSNGGNDFGWGNNNGNDGNDFGWGNSDSNLCRCYNGTSPCSNHHGYEEEES